MNTRNSSRDNSRISGIRGRSVRTSSRNNISIDLQDQVPGSGSKVVHSPAPRPSISKPLGRTESSNSLNLSTTNTLATRLAEEGRSSSTSLLFQDIQIMDNQELSANAQAFVPSNESISVTGPSRVMNEPSMNPINTYANNNMNTTTNTPFDSLIALMEQSMRNTREEFRKELSSIRDSISQIGSANQSNTFRPSEIVNNFPNSNTAKSNSNRFSNNQSDLSVGNNVKLEKWKISYDGIGSVSDFIFKVETLCSRTKCSDEHLLSNFHVLLEGKAERWYWLFTRQTRNVTYPLLRHALTKEFGHLESDHDILLKMSNRKQQHKESYDDSIPQLFQ